jgi:hypothetical protein
MAQPGEAISNSPEHLRCAVPVLNIGTMHQNEHHQSQRIGEDMALAFLDLLVCVIA